MTRAGDAVIVLRGPRAGELERVRELVRAAGVFRPEEVNVAIEVFEGAVRSPGVDYLGIGAYEDDRLVGFTLFGPTPCTVGTWDLYWIVVDPAVHRHGVGRRLMTAAETAMAQRGARLVVVETSSRADYEPTRAFYDALGYARAARIADYYAPRDDLVVFRKSLVSSTGETTRDG